MAESTGQRAALELFALLLHSRRNIVFAESCTAGLIAATMGRLPGVSEVLAGSAVVYQIPTKVAWLGIRQSDVDEHGVVSQVVSEQMAEHVLRQTPHAAVAASVTGHLGPDAPADLDGTAWTTVALRKGNDMLVHSRKLQLMPPPASSSDAAGLRVARQERAVTEVLQFCLDVLRETSPGLA